jgi:DNA-binding transcriptional MerR regulator
MQFVPKKLYYKISEVCEILGVEAHVLRYWETEFPALAPPKNRSGQRTYRPKDIELLLRIRRLLYEEGYTIAGARKQLSGAVAAKAPESPEPLQDNALEPGARNSERLLQVRRELENILTLLDRE